MITRVQYAVEKSSNKEATEFFTDLIHQFWCTRKQGPTKRAVSEEKIMGVPITFWCDDSDDISLYALSHSVTTMLNYIGPHVKAYFYENVENDPMFTIRVRGCSKKHIFKKPGGKCFFDNNWIASRALSRELVVDDLSRSCIGVGVNAKVDSFIVYADDHQSHYEDLTVVVILGIHDRSAFFPKNTIKFPHVSVK
jgi:hypothetical protein